MSVASAKRENARAVDVSALALEMVPHLPGWTLEPVRGDSDRLDRQTAHFSRPDGARFYLSLVLWPGPAVHVSGYWPKLENWGEFRPRETPSINFSPFKTPEAAAKDITRRFLPEYLPLYEEQRIAFLRSAAQANEAADLAGRLAAILGGTIHERGAEGWRIYHIGQELDVDISRWGGVKFQVEPQDDDERGARAVMLAAVLSTWRKAGER